MAGDDDLVSIGHLEAMRDTIPEAQLAVVPGTSHGLPLEKPELTARLILDFLADDQAPKIMPTAPPKVNRPAVPRTHLSRLSDAVTGHHGAPTSKGAPTQPPH